MSGGLQVFDDVASTADPRKSHGVIQRLLELTEEQWADRSYCWQTDFGCMRGSQPCLRSRPDGPGSWAIVVWRDRAGPYAERAADLVRI